MPSRHTVLRQGSEQTKVYESSIIAYQIVFLPDYQILIKHHIERHCLSTFDSGLKSQPKYYKSN